MNQIRLFPEDLSEIMIDTLREAKGELWNGSLVAAATLGVATVARFCGIPLLTNTPMTQFVGGALALPLSFVAARITDELIVFSGFATLTVKVAHISGDMLQRLFSLCCPNPNRATALCRFQASLAIGCAVTGVSVGAFFGKAFFGSYAFGGGCALLGFGLGTHERDSLIGDVEAVGIPLTYIFKPVKLSGLAKATAIFRVGVIAREIFSFLLTRIEN